jgi:hypothetical protein
MINISRRVLLATLALVTIAVFGAWIWRNSSAGAIDNRSDSVEIGSVGEIGELNVNVPPGEIEGLKARAVTGDNEAAGRLGVHYSRVGQSADARRWLTLAANRGDCSSMSQLREIAENAGDHRGSRRWNEQMRRHVCTWGKTYPEVSNPKVEDLPLWNDNLR